MPQIKLQVELDRACPNPRAEAFAWLFSTRRTRRDQSPIQVDQIELGRVEEGADKKLAETIKKMVNAEGEITVGGLAIAQICRLQAQHPPKLHHRLKDSTVELGRAWIIQNPDRPKLRQVDVDSVELDEDGIGTACFTEANLKGSFNVFDLGSGQPDQHPIVGGIEVPNPQRLSRTFGLIRRALTTTIDPGAFNQSLDFNVASVSVHTAFPND